MKVFLAIVAVSTVTFLTGQNLVINPSFEDTIACPLNSSQISACVGWSSCSITPDYFNSCSIPPSCCPWNNVSVPSNIFGYQLAATGNAYAGFIAYGSVLPNLREFIGGNLATPLTVGTKYYASFKINAVINPGSYVNCTCNNLGLLFSKVLYGTCNGCLPVPKSPQIYINSIVTDSANWTRISGSFVADSAYSHVIIGNFSDNQSTDTLIMNGDSKCNSYAYYFVDDICVSTDSLDCGQPVDILNYSDPQQIYLFPNPLIDQATLHFDNAKNKICTLTLYNLRGQIVQLINNIRGGQVVIQRNDLASGLYYFTLRTSDHTIANGKLAVD